MVVRIRFVPVGKKTQTSYQIKVIDSRKPRDSGAYLEHLGYWNPSQGKLELNQEEYQAWLKKGAQPTESLNSRYNKRDIVSDLENLPSNQIKVQVPEQKEENKEGFQLKDLQKKLKENNYWLIKNALLNKWEKGLIEKFFKIKWRKIKSKKEKREKGNCFHLGRIFSHKGEEIKEKEELFPLAPFNFEFSITLPKEKGPGTTYLTKNSPISLVEAKKLTPSR